MPTSAGIATMTLMHGPPMKALTVVSRRLFTPLFLFGVLGPSLLFAELTQEVVDEGGFGWDIRIPRFVHGYDTPSLDRVMLLFSWLGSFRGLVPLAVAVLAFLVARRRYGDALFLAVAMTGNAVLVALLKEGIHRLRPEAFPPEASAGGFAFPSGHAANSMALFAVLAVLLWRTRWRWPTIVLGAPLVAAVGLSRVYLGVHYPSDVLGGWSAALVLVVALDLAGIRSAGVGSRVLEPLYRAYTARLRHGVQRGPLPRHVAVILDGNRRWASRVGLSEPAAGHQRGADKIDELLSWCASLGIPEVTLWGLSGENLARAQAQLEPLLEVIASKLDSLAERSRLGLPPMRIRAFGRTEQLPPRLREAITNAEAAAPEAVFRLNIALSYSGRDELVDACRRLIDDLLAEGVPPHAIAGHVTRESLSGRLYTAGSPDPDLIIRTSGELRLSGFLLWQSAYSEYYFSDVYWPAFRELDFLRALRTFQQRQRRFGR